MNAIVKIVLALLKPLMSIITPKVEGELEKWLRAFHKRCLLTPNPWDDILSGFLCDIFDVEL